MIKLAYNQNYLYFRRPKNTVMAFTRYKRKEKKNRTVSRLRTQMLKINNLVVKVVSPNKDKVVVIEE